MRTRIFFDVDGVIMDNIHMRKGWIRRWDETMEQDLGIAPSKFDEIFKDWFPLAQLDRVDFEREMQRWLDWHDYDLKAWQVINYWNEKDTNVNENVYGTIKKLSALGNVELYVATNQTHERARYLWDVFGFKDYFKDIYYSARLGVFKHDADYFAKIEKELHFNPRVEEHIFFDDDPKNIASSSSRGWNAALVDGPSDVADHPIIKSLLA